MNVSELKGKTFSFPIRVYYEDTDAGGLVYHANYVCFYERARTEFLSALNIEQDTLLAENIAFIVKSFFVDNLRPARFNDRLLVKSEVVELKKSRIKFNQWVELNGAVINKAEIIIAVVNLTNMKPQRIPESIYEVITRVS